MANSRKEWAGNAAATTPSSTMTSGAPAAGATFTVTSGTGLPTGVYPGGFVLVIDRGTASEEKILCSARSGTTITVATSGRAWDGTTAAAHGGGVTTGTVEHCVDADTLTDLSAHVYDTTRDDHTQYQAKSLLTVAGDMIYATAASTWARLAKGAAYQALAMNAGATAPSWVASIQSLLTAKGSLLSASAANTPVALAVGSDFTRLQSRAAASNGIEWASLASTNGPIQPGVNESTSSTSFTDLATPGPAVTATTGTTALVFITAGVIAPAVANAFAVMGVAASGASTVVAFDNNSLFLQNPGTGAIAVQATYCFLFTGLTPGSNTFTAKYRVTAGTGNWQGRNLVVVPL